MTTRKKSIKQRDNITNLKHFIMTRKLNKAKAKTLTNNRLNMSGGEQSQTVAEDVATQTQKPETVAAVITASVANALEQPQTQTPETVAAVITASVANALEQPQTQTPEPVAAVITASVANALEQQTPKEATQTPETVAAVITASVANALKQPQTQTQTPETVAAVITASVANALKQPQTQTPETVAAVITASVANALKQQTPKEATQTQKPETVAAVITASVANALKQQTTKEADEDPVTKDIIEVLIKDYNELETDFTTIKESKKTNTKAESGLLDIINRLLDNKRRLSKFEKQMNIAPILDSWTKAMFERLTEAIKLYINLINDIMNYLKVNFSKNMKYQWIEIVSLSREDKETIIDMQYKKGNYDKKTAIIDKLYKSSNNGMWTFDVWIPDKNGKTISLADEEGRNELDKKLKVKTKSGEIIATFVTEPIILYSCRFLKIKYNIKDEVNYQPVIEDANDESLAKNGKTYTERFRSYGREIKNASKRSLREELKKYIGSIIYTEITDKKDPDKKEDINLLKRSLRFEDTKQDIRTILVNKISKIFADGETRFNLFNKENLKKNFAEDDKDAKDDEEGGAEQGGGVGAEQEGGGAFGFRNFDKDDAKNFISFILANLRALLAECNGFKKNIQDLLLTTYLKTLFSKIGPAELNKLLPDIENIKEASEHIIGHFFDRLLNRNAIPKRSDDEQSADDSTAHQAEATLEKSDDEHSAETSIGHAAAISQLNFQLKRNVKSFMAAIVDISLHTDELIGTKEKLANYLDNEYDKAMNIPFGLDKRRIENLEINNALREILGSGLNSIKGFRTQITKIDEHIDSITEQNIDDKMRKLIEIGLLHNIKLGNNSFTYNLPEKFANILKQKQDTIAKEQNAEASATTQLEEIKTLVNEIGKPSDKLTDTQKAKFDKLMTVLGSPPQSMKL